MRWRIRRPHCFLIIALVFVFLSCSTVILTRRNSGRGINGKDIVLETGKDLPKGITTVSAIDQIEQQNQLQQAASLIGDLPCRINGEKTLTCLRDGNDEIYVPFKGFLEKSFQITGHVERRPDGEEVFYWWHSNAKMQRPSFDIYDPFGVFGSFATYNVENRDRVKCISAVDGVPLSVQWTANAYHYPIQIAQFALEHYSKNLTEPDPVIVDINDGSILEEDSTRKRRPDSPGVWRTAPEAKSNSQIEYEGQLIHFKTPSNLDSPGLYAPLNDAYDGRKLLTLRLEVKFAFGSNASFSVSLERLDSHTFYTLHYVQVDEVITIGDRNQIYFGLGDEGKRGSGTDQWRIVTRNLLTDFSKGLALLSMGNSFGSNAANKRSPAARQRHRLAGETIRLVALSLRGEGWLKRHGGVTLRSSSHWDHFMDAANWFLKNQDSKGGWPTPVRRTLAENRLKLEPGWYSAMAQGHGMSVLCRAFHATGRREFLDAAFRASIPFTIDATNGGVRNRFMDTKYIWYEEYPTTPGTFVLNGFIYSLVGLYDLRACLPGNRTIEELYQIGLDSLKALLPFYDTGFGSVYDLRHISLKIAPNVARWDYHSVHVYQLLWMYLIEKDPLFLNTAERWLGYARGERAKHN